MPDSSVTTPILQTAGNGHDWITFEAYDTPEWHMAVQWLKHEGFMESGLPVVGRDEWILPSFVRGEIVIAAGFDTWSGNYLLAQCKLADDVILTLAELVSAVDRREPGWVG